MSKKVRKSRLEFKPRVSTTPMTANDYQRSMELLAKLIAQAYAADNPHLFTGSPSDPKEVDNGDKAWEKARSDTEAA